MLLCVCVVCVNYQDINHCYFFTFQTWWLTYSCGQFWRRRFAYLCIYSKSIYWVPTIFKVPLDTWQIQRCPAPRRLAAFKWIDKIIWLCENCFINDDIKANILVLLQKTKISPSFPIACLARRWNLFCFVTL